VFPCVHGTFGEDGTLQGLFELADLPYVGAGVVGSATGMDKIIMKAAFQAAGLPVVGYLWFRRSRWERSPDEVLDEVESRLRYPLFVKPANLGSSIGISKARRRDDLKGALEVAASYDRRLLVEEAVDNAVEINCSVLGNDDPIPSVCEQPVAWQEFLSYEDKYLRGEKGQGMKGASRRIPAPISPELTRRIQGLAVAAFQVVDCAGIARVDCLLNEATEEVFVNEINTIPGSLSFYLWEPSGVSFVELTDRLIQLALERHAEKAKTHYSYDSTILRKIAAGAKTGRGQTG
jgi:D-alanine-D-alanine ligase